jgi:hypothetical protein
MYDSSALELFFKNSCGDLAHGGRDMSVVCRFGVEIKKLQRQRLVSSLSASRVMRAGNKLSMKLW